METIDTSTNVQLSNERIDELLSLMKENNIMMKEILHRMRDMDCADKMLKQYATNFGIGLCSTIVGDRILGLGRNNQG